MRGIVAVLSVESLDPPVRIFDLFVRVRRESAI